MSSTNNNEPDVNLFETDDKCYGLFNCKMNRRDCLEDIVAFTRLVLFVSVMCGSFFLFTIEMIVLSKNFDIIYKYFTIVVTFLTIQIAPFGLLYLSCIEKYCYDENTIHDPRYSEKLKKQTCSVCVMQTFHILFQAGMLVYANVPR